MFYKFHILKSISSSYDCYFPLCHYMENFYTVSRKKVTLFLNVSVKELPNFMKKYYLLAELLIFKYW